MPQNFIYKQTQTTKLSLNQNMKKSLDVLKMNENELNDMLKKLADSNPVLDFQPSKDLNGMLEETFSNAKSLKEELYLQLHTQKHTYNKKICAYIIESLDDHGFFKEDLISASQVLNCSVEKLQEQLAIIQSMEPAGVGALNQTHCILLQLERSSQPEALHLMKNYSQEICENNFEAIQKQEGWSSSKIQSLLNFIRSLNLNPCAQYDTYAADIKIPDFEIIKHESTLEIKPCQSGILSLDPFYSETLKKNKAFKSFFEEAHFYIDSLNKRNATLLLLMNALIKKQKSHFLFDDELESCSLKEIGEECGFHESTVSRTLSNKYYLWGNEVYAVKDLFVSKTKGGSSKDSVLKALQAFIDQEDPFKPYSDQQLCVQLEEMGIEVSRRAIAKYRNVLHIPSSSKRKKKLH